MDVVINLLIWAHIVAFVVGGSNLVVGRVIGSRLATATPEMRAGYVGVMGAMAQAGKFAMGVLLVTGPLIMWLRYGGLGGASVWFWIKMALVALMLAAIIIGGINFKKSLAGNGEAGRRAGLAHRVTGLAFLGVLLSAVFAFNQGP